MKLDTIRRLPALALLMAGSLLLSSCFVIPGKFTSALDLRSDGTFSFSYEGEILFLALAEGEKDEEEDGEHLEELAIEAEAEDVCFDEETFEDRDCTEEELAEREAERLAREEQQAASERRMNDQMKRMLAGVDPSDPEAGNKIAEMLERQAGYDSVTYKGEGKFDVRFAVNSTLDHDFTFPSIEGMTFVAPFVSVYRRDGGVVRVNAPGFSSEAIMNGMNPALLAMGSAFPGGNSSGPDPSELEGILEGTFTISTDGEILANNTDEGPTMTAAGQQLLWEASPQLSQIPTALIRLGD